MKLLRSVLTVTGITAILLNTGCASQQVITGNTGNQTPVEAVRAERTYLEGKWSYTMTNPDQSPFSGIILVQRSGPAGYSGWISVNNIDYEAKTTITRAEVQGENFIYVGEVITMQGSYPFELKGTIKGDKMEGQSKLHTQDGLMVYKLTATRK